MKYITIAILTIFGLSTNAQDSTTVYLDARLEVTNAKRAVYTGKLAGSGQTWVLNAYEAKQGHRILNAQYKDKKLRIKHGRYNLYYPGGHQLAATTFYNNVSDSFYTSWHPNGNMNDSGSLYRGVRHGVWKKWYPNGQVEFTGFYNNGAEDSLWHWYRTTGHPATKELYRDQKLADLTCYDSTGKEAGFSCRIDAKPTPSMSIDFQDYMEENLFYPPEALKRGIEGVVDFEFTITKEGKLTSIQFTNEANPLFQKEVERMLKSVEEWIPAISHNRIQDYTYKTSVPFYLPE